MKKAIWKIMSILITAAMLAVLAAGCSQEKADDTGAVSNGAFPAKITDVYGTEVTVEKEPQRIVALAPSTVEVLYKLGMEHRIVGVTEYCDFPAEALDLPKVGDFNGVNIEKIIEAKPDIVFAGAGMTEETFNQLTNLGITIMVTEPRTVSQIPETFMMIGKATGTESKAKEIADDVTASMNEIKDKVGDAEKVKVYYVISFGKEGNWTAGKGTFISDLIAMAGGENIADDVESWMDYSIEKVVEKNPDVILVSAMIANGNKDILDNEQGYTEINAVRNDRVIILDDNLTQKPGPRIVEGLELIAKAIHPEISF